METSNVQTQAQAPEFNTTVEQNRIEKSSIREKIVLARIYTANYQKENTVTAELKQTILNKSVYPGKSVSNSFQDNIFDDSEFNFEKKTYENKETRVAWLNVPAGSSPEKVQSLLDKHENACIYKVLSNKPILTSDQEGAIRAGLTTKDVIADSQVVRYGADHEQFPGKLILDELGRPQYRQNYFKTVATEDISFKSQDVNDYFASALIRNELAMDAATKSDTL